MSEFPRLQLRAWFWSLGCFRLGGFLELGWRDTFALVLYLGLFGFRVGLDWE